MTSSVNCRQTPTPAEHYGPLMAALADVAEQSFFACVDPCDAASFEERAAGVDNWLRVSVGFQGAFAGLFSCTLPEPLAAELFDSFLGQADESARNETLVFDLVGEFGNMICGTWLTRTAERRRFALHRPEVRRVPPPVVTTGAEGGQELLCLNDRPLAVGLVFVPWQG
ncbi:MAG: chemotaxis protein CheX [Acidobacteriota bacterium]|nr:chemotaxis protein CheX [Acidobacteriota bacterium]